MRRHRPFTSYCAAQDEDDAAGGADYSAPIRKAGGGSAASYLSSADASALETRCTVVSGEARRKEGGAGRITSRSHSGSRRGGRSSRPDASSTPFHSSQALAHLGGLASSPPQPFYDGPSLQHSIPALLQQFTKASSTIPFPSSTAKTAASAAADGTREPRRSRMAPQQGALRVSNSGNKVRGASLNSTTTTTTTTTSVQPAAARLDASRNVDEGPAAAKRRLLQQWQHHEHTGDRGAMRYVVVQQPAAVKGSHAYKLPSVWTSPEGTTRLPVAAVHNNQAALAQASPAAELQTLPSAQQQGSSTHSPDGIYDSAETRQASSSHNTRTRSPPPFHSVRHQHNDGDAAAAAAAQWSSGSDASVTEHSAFNPRVQLSATSDTSHTSRSSLTGDAYAATHSTRSSIRNSAADAHSAFGSSSFSRQAASSSSSKSHMRHLFSTLLDKSKTGFTQTPSSHASTLLSDATGHQHASTTAVQSPHRHPNRNAAAVHIIASPPARPPVRGAVAGGVESRGASPASPAPRGRPTTPRTSAADQRAPFEGAVMEGGDPLVLRHTIDYLLAKARRLEAQNAALWVQGHSWNPRRSIEPQDASVTQPAPHQRQILESLRAAKLTAQPPTARVTRATGASATQTQAAAVAATQTDHFAPRSQQQQQQRTSARVFVQRQPRTAATTMDILSSDRSSVMPASPPLSSRPRSPDGDADFNEADNSRCATPRPPTQRSVTVSSPSALMEASATGPMQRAETGVQHEPASHDVGTTTTVVTEAEPPPQPPSRSTAATQHTMSSSLPSSSAATPTAAAQRVSSADKGRSLRASSLRTPPLRAAYAVLDADNDNDALGATLLASTVRSHRSVESRRSAGSMAPVARVAPLHASALRNLTQLSQSPRSTADERAVSAGNFTSNGSFGSMGGRSTTHNKQVQTASILSPAEEDSESETLLDSHVDNGMATTVFSTERTAVIELHTSASYNRSTVRRLRAYCNELEMTRQQLRRRAVRSPTSLAASTTTAGGTRWATATAAAAAAAGYSHSTSPRVPSVSSVLPPLRPSMTTNPSPTISRPFFASEYADPEVDATLHDVEETPAVDTMIVLQEDGSGAVSKRVVDGSPSRVSTSTGRSPSPTANAQPRRHRRDETPTASSIASYHGLELEEACVPSSSRANSQPLFFSSSAYAANERAGVARHRSREEQAVLLNASLRSDTHHSRNVREAAPNVHLGRSMRSDSAVSWPASEQREAHSPDILPLTQASAASERADAAISSRFALPQPFPAAKHVEVPSSPAAALMEAPQSRSGADHRFVATPPPSASVETLQQLLHTAVPQGTAAAAASGGSSSRFAVPGASASDAVVRTASLATSRSSGTPSRSCSGEGQATAGRQQRECSSSPSPPPAAAMWNPKAGLVNPPRSPEQPVLQKGKAVDQSGIGCDFPPPPTPPLPADDIDSPSPKHLTATSAAPVESAAPTVVSGGPLRVNEHVWLNEMGSTGPNSPAPHSPPSSRRSDTQHAAKDGSDRCRPRSITVEFVDEASEPGRQHHGVGARGAARLPPDTASASTEASTEEGGDDVAEADERHAADPMPIDREAADIDDATRADKEGGLPSPPPPVASSLPSATRVRLISPSPPRPAVVTEVSDAVEDAHQAEEETEVTNSLDVSGTSSWRRRRTMPPMQRPPMPPSRTIVLEEDTSPSASLSRSLHSFSSTSSSSEAESDAEDEEALQHSEWF